MKLRSLLASLGLCISVVSAPGAAHAAPGDNYTPDDAFTSPRTQWWRDGHFGMFMHFGMYAAYGGEYRRPDGTVCRTWPGEWIQNNCSIPWPEYEAKAATFNPTGFDANAVIGAAKAAGQKYLVITAKHHDGFSMWPTAVNDWNLQDRTPFQRDILAELATAARAQGVKLGFYYSIMDWHDPDAQPGSSNYAAYLGRVRAQLQELLTNYGDIAVLWFDGNWPPSQYTDQEGARIEAYVRQLSPQTIINDRVGNQRALDGDHHTPENEILDGPFNSQLWESCVTMNDSWGYRFFDDNYKSATTLTRNLVGIAASSGNYLLNVGPDGQGLIPQPQLDRMAQIGSWMNTNGPAVQGAQFTGLVAKPSWGVVSRNGNKLYASVYNWPATGSALHLTAKAPFTVNSARILKTGAAVSVTASGDGYDLHPTDSQPDPIASVIELDITPTTAKPLGSGTGLKAQFWTNNSFSGPPAVTRIDSTINNRWQYEGSPAPAIPTTHFSGRWTGYIEPRYSQTYTFTTLSDDTVRLWINGQLVVNNTTPHAPQVDNGTIALTAGQRYPITMEVTQQAGESAAKLFWSSPDTPQQIVPASQLYLATTLNDDAPGITYTGTWQTSTDRTYATDLGSDVHYTMTNGDAFSYTFTGTGIDFRSEKYSDQGLIDFYLDGVFQATVDTTNPTRLSQQLLYSRRDLTQGQHTLKAVKRSGQFMLVDRIDIYP